MGFTGPSGGRQRVALDERREEIAAGEAHQARRQLAREAEQARGGAPLQRVWRRMRAKLSTEDPPAPSPAPPPGA